MNKNRSLKTPLKTIACAIFIFGINFAPQAMANEALTISSDIPYADDSIGSAAIRSECTWTKQLAESIMSYSKGKIVATDQRLEGQSGRILIIKITGVHAVGGSGYSGTKWASLHVDLSESGKITRSTDFKRESGFGSAWTACGTLTKISRVLGKDVVTWVNMTKEQPAASPTETKEEKN